MMKPDPIPRQSNLSLTPEQLRVIRVVLGYNHSHFVRRYLMHPGCMCPDEMVEQIASALPGTNYPLPVQDISAPLAAPGGLADKTSA